ncbi:sensor domain-containing diguanylate cyclase [Marinobacter orientalis]|uniref:Sensor domain-containing diguanylate cyclase n=1 Tax=Marinobacter orientalis TaxID=1928859 RepID=A0A7Y0WTW8_9GAMM|nr:diguanylate cyclase [Marinobacter orientalis]NMT65140.1 sensor domain-containing diguanylate cyclase [Marinobacter orientalis]TGX48916.1 sensor domain-containing diguanylate cyclase [Marinobacter orientalis]
MNYGVEFQNPADAKTHARRYVLNSLFFIFTFWALNQVAYLFTVTEGVSLFYPPSAYAMFLIFLLGGKYLPVHFLAIYLGGLPYRDVFNYNLEMFIPDLRQFVIYGLAGLILRKINSPQKIINAKFFLSVMVASVLTALISTVIFVGGIGSNTLSFFSLIDRSSSFFVGNLTGAVTAIPIFLLFYQFWKLGWRELISSLLRNMLKPQKVVALLIIIILTALVIQLGKMDEQFSRYYYLILIPVVWSTVKWGLGNGLVFAFIGNLFALSLFIFSGYSHYGIFEVQIMFVISIVSVILIGLVQDERDLFYHRAMYDELTGLANMRLFREVCFTSIARANRKGHESSILFIDVDGFKSVNDTLGHKFGDEILQKLSQELKYCVRGSDIVARFGGDEFVVFLDETSDEEAAGVSEKIIKQLATLFRIHTDAVELGVSIGISLYPRDGADIDTLIRKSDEAMYLAKKEGKNTYRIYGDHHR